jgi:hypothetical protein
MVLCVPIRRIGFDPKVWEEAQGVPEILLQKSIFNTVARKDGQKCDSCSPEEVRNWAPSRIQLYRLQFQERAGADCGCKAGPWGHQ